MMQKTFFGFSWEWHFNQNYLRCGLCIFLNNYNQGHDKFTIPFVLHPTRRSILFTTMLFYRLVFLFVITKCPFCNNATLREHCRPLFSGHTVPHWVLIRQYWSSWVPTCLVGDDEEYFGFILSLYNCAHQKLRCLPCFFTVPPDFLYQN